MRSKNLFSLVTLVSSLSILAGCGGGTDGLTFNFGNNTVGKPIGELSSMSDPNSSDRTQIVVFDKTVRLIHEFDLTSMSVMKTLNVDHPESNHAVLFDQNTGLIADFSEGHMATFDRTSQKTSDPLALTGRVLSGAYDPIHSTLVVYDDMNSVGLLRVDANGSPTQAWTGGPILQSDIALTAGDLIDDGSLVLALADGSVAKVDVTQTLALGHWVFTSVATGLGRIKWVAPVHGMNDRVIVLTDTTFAVVSLTDGSTIASRTLASGESIVFQSKTKDAHILIRRGTQLSIVYTDGIAIHAPSLNLSSDLFLSSRLSLSSNTWSVISSGLDVSWTYKSKEIETKGRTLLKYRLSDFNALRKKPLPDQAQLDVSEKYIFALYPSEFGYGERLSVTDDSTAKINGFNAGYIH